jgi:hypothetical protein
VRPRRKSWADRQGYKTGLWGEIVEGIPIREENRATVFEFRKEGIEALQSYLRQQYTRKGVHAVLFGIEGNNDIKYAVFVRPGFLKNVDEED